MQLSQSLAQEIRSYIKNLLSKEVIIVGRDGSCISMPDDAKVADEVATLPEAVFRQSDMQVLELSDGPHVIIPLQYESETVALLMLPDKVQEIQTYAPLIKSFAELLVQQYQANHQPILDSTDQFITKLLHNTSPADLPGYESDAQVLGYNFDEKRIAIVIELKDFWQKCLASFDQPSFDREEIIKVWKRSIENKLTSFFTRSTDNIVAYIGNDKFIVFKGTNGEPEDNIIKLLKTSHSAIFEPLKNFNVSDLVVGVGNAYSGIQGLITSYREANLALDFGSRLWGTNKSYFFGDLGILSILGEGNREKEIQFANQLLHKLTNEELIKTLECFFEENLNLTETAQRMKIHRNTVIYRLNQIATILEVDPRIFEQAMTIKIALLIKRLFG